MLVDVVQLRRDGYKRPSDEVRSAEPVRGNLRFSFWMASGDGPEPAGKVVFAKLMPGGGEHSPGSIPDLNHAVVTKIDGDSLVVTGMERPGPHGAGPVCRQTWWCRLVK